MSQKIPSTPYSASFSGQLANILYDTPADPDRDADEVMIVERLTNWVTSSGRTRKQIWVMSLYIDEQLIPLLSGKNLLQIAKLFEDRAPAMITQMRNLRAHKEHLERAAEMAEILSPDSLDRLLSAVRKSVEEA